MDWSQDQYDRIAHLLPKQRGNVEIDIGKSRGGWTTKIHSVVADVKLPIKRTRQ